MAKEEQKKTLNEILSTIQRELKAPKTQKNTFWYSWDTFGPTGTEEWPDGYHSYGPTGDRGMARRVPSVQFF